MRPQQQKRKTEHMTNEMAELGSTKDLNLVSVLRYLKLEKEFRDLRLCLSRGALVELV